MFTLNKSRCDKKEPGNLESFLSLICPGTGKNVGVGRKMAIKTGKKNHQIKIAKFYIKDSVNLQGGAIDDAGL